MFSKSDKQKEPSAKLYKMPRWMVVIEDGSGKRYIEERSGYDATQLAHAAGAKVEQGKWKALFGFTS